MTPKNVISPTPGRIVWFYPDPNGAEGGFTRAPEGQPLGAMVAAVHSDTMVNLMVVDAAGITHSRTSVRLLQDGDEVPRTAHCRWMPFQKGQAAAAAVVAAKEAVHFHAEVVLYPAIKEAMEKLNELHPGFNMTVNQAFNMLHRAFWSEAPCPSSALQLRPESPADQETSLDSAQYPQGKLNEHDEGALPLRVGREEDKVAVHFGKPVAWIGMSADDAMALAELLAKHAIDIGLTKPFTLMVS